MEPATNARSLRNNPTHAEAALWRALSARKVAGVRFNRQVQIEPYICDFVARSVNLVIEVDGGQHADCPADTSRTKILESKGYRVLRFWNNDVLGNLGGVVAEIERALNARPSPSPSRKREGSERTDGAHPALPSRLREGSGEGVSLTPAFLDELRARTS